jgi:hypothetical protein
MGIVKSVDYRGAATIHVSELGSSYDKVVPLNTTNLNRVAVGDVVKCTFSDEFFTELIVLGVANIKEVPAVSSFSPVISSPIPGQVIQYNGTSWVNASAVEAFEYKVGDTGPGGGTIFFVDRHNEYADFTYLEVGPTSTQGLRTWAPSSPVNYQSAAVSGADSRALGAGYQNTIDIVAQGHTDNATSAALYCDQLTYGDKSDWYLPSIAELALVARVVAFELSMPGFVNFQNYWSSSESSATQVWAGQMTSYGVFTTSKLSPAWVRPVRKF